MFTCKIELYHFFFFSMFLNINTDDSIVTFKNIYYAIRKKIIKLLIIIIILLF